MDKINLLSLINKTKEALQKAMEYESQKLIKLKLLYEQLKIQKDNENGVAND